MGGKDLKEVWEINKTVGHTYEKGVEVETIWRK